MPVALKIETCLAGPVNEKTGGRGRGVPRIRIIANIRHYLWGF